LAQGHLSDFDNYKSMIDEDEKTEVSEIEEH